MDEEAQMCLDETQEGMESALSHLDQEFQKIRAGKASPQMLAGIKIDYYGSITAGKLDPDEVIDCMQWFFNFVPITDLKALGAFGEKLEQYRHLSKEIIVNPFEYIKIRKQQKPIALKVMKEMLVKKGIRSKIEKRGRNLAISFSGLPCPVCKKISANARAYPPDYTLRCFNINCATNSGMPLIKWAGIKNKGAVKTKNSKSVFDLKPPTEFQDLKSSRDIIYKALETTDDTLIISTPGVGKTRQTLNHLANYPKDKLVIYSAYNKDLQREAYEKILALSDEHDKFHLIRPRDEICIKKDELKKITSKGFSPAQILCPRCDHRLNCEYYKQRERMEAGVFFVTHHMLQYLESRVPNPDLIILDENLKGGFLLEDSCTELQMRTLATVLTRVDYLLVNDLMASELALTKIWRDDNYFTSRSMDVYIAKLRKYLKRDDTVEILNIHGEGFRLLVKEEEK